jgi:ceramide glucosyltransferase
MWPVAAATLAVRIAAGLVLGAGILKDRKVLRDSWMIPLRDFFGFAVWLAGLFGTTVRWRDRRLRLQSDGKICEQ